MYPTITVITDTMTARGIFLQERGTHTHKEQAAIPCYTHYYCRFYLVVQLIAARWTHKLIPPILHMGKLWGPRCWQPRAASSQPYRSGLTNSSRTKLVWNLHDGKRRGESLSDAEGTCQPQWSALPSHLPAGVCEHACIESQGELIQDQRLSVKSILEVLSVACRGDKQRTQSRKMSDRLPSLKDNIPCTSCPDLGRVCDFLAARYSNSFHCFNFSAVADMFTFPQWH